jgi:predicted permease
VRLRALPIEDPQSLALVELADRTGWRGSQATPYPALTNPLWERFRDRQDAFAGVLAWGNNDFDLGADGDTRRAHGLFVSGDFFRVLGVRALVGRTFRAADDRRGCGLPRAVVSHAFWQRELGGDPRAVGRTITVGHQPVEVIGVTPPGFTGLEVGRSYDVAVPICSQEALWTEGNWLDEGTVWWLTVAGRLRPGSTIETAREHLRALSAGVFESTLPPDYPAANVKDYLAFSLTAVPASNGVSRLRGRYADPLLLLLATSGIVLLITCANLANLMLARAAARERELAVRLALGASRGRLVRQMTAEGLLLAAAGGGLGLLLSGVLSRALVGLLATQWNALYLDLEPNRAVFAFAFGLSALTVVLFAVVPALRATRLPPGEVMKAAGRGTTAGKKALGLRRALVASQVAFSMVLLVGALLFARTLGNVLAVDPGFDPRGVIVASVDFSRAPVPAGGRAVLRAEIVERVRALAGVAAAAEVGIVPLTGGTDNKVWPDGALPGSATFSNFAQVGDGYFETMTMTLLGGRDFDAHDTAESPRVAIVNEAFARRLGLGSGIVGRRFRREATPSEPELVFEIVGVVANTKYWSLREESVPIAFLSSAQSVSPDFFTQLVLKAEAPLPDVAARLRGAIGRLSPMIAVDVRSFEKTVRESMQTERLMATLSGFFGFLAALISALGLYGVMSYAVGQRTHEIGIRMALGADRRRVGVLILGEAARLLTLGLVIGAALALAAARTTQSLLFGLKPHDPATFAVAALLLSTVALAASYLPSRRAAGLDPTAALREE